jgi:hypothetical protein
MNGIKWNISDLIGKTKKEKVLNLIQGVLFLWLICLIIRDGLFESSFNIFFFLVIVLCIFLFSKKEDKKVSATTNIIGMSVTIIIYYILHFFFGFYP